jgi:hypothetical protein
VLAGGLWLCRGLKRGRRPWPLSYVGRRIDLSRVARSRMRDISSWSWRRWSGISRAELNEALADAEGERLRFELGPHNSYLWCFL